MPPALVFLVVVMAQLADLGTSLIGFRHGAIELNPLGQTPGHLILMKAIAIWALIAALYVAGRLRSVWAWHIVALAAILLSGLALEAAWHNLGL